MFAATTRPWYFPTWVSGQMPLTSPIAHRRSPALRRASTGIPRPVGYDADGLEAEPVDARTPAGGDQQPVAAQRPAVVEFQDVVLILAPRGGRVHAESELDAVPTQGLGERLPERPRLVGE